MASNNMSKCRKLNKHEKEILRLCLELATQSYIPFATTSHGVRVQRLSYLATLFTFMVYVMISTYVLAIKDYFIVHLTGIVFIVLFLLYWLVGKQISAEYSRIYLNMRDLLRKRCFDKFSQIECKEDLCEEDWELTNMLLTLQPIFIVNTKKKTK